MQIGEQKSKGKAKASTESKLKLGASVDSQPPAPLILIKMSVGRQDDPQFTELELGGAGQGLRGGRVVLLVAGQGPVL